MRHSVQLSLTAPAINHEHASELTAISEILDSEPRIAALVDQDLTARCKRNARTGRPGLTGDQVLRIALVRQMNGWTYEELNFHLIDSLTYRTFCRVGALEKPPSRSTLAENLRLIRQESLSKINALLVTGAEARNIENGDKVRIDSTVVKAAIHAPTDSSLLYDGIRCLVRLLREAERFGFDCYHKHVKRAKRRLIEIQHSKPNEKGKRLTHYRDLITLAEATAAYAVCAIEHVRSEKKAEKSVRLCSKLESVTALLVRAIDQTRRRVINGESVPATEKIVSIFEPHTDVIVKDHRDTHYGHKIFLTGGKSGLILDCALVKGNPADSSWSTSMLQRHKRLFGSAPRQASLDGGFASKDNLLQAKSLGVADICFAKRRGIAVLDMVKSSWVYRKLRAFRAGIESVISWLKRSFGLDRCIWKGPESFMAYVRIAVLTANLIILARHRLA